MSRETVRLPDGSSVEVHNDIRLATGELVTYETHFRFGSDDVAVGVDTLRFIDQARLTGISWMRGSTRSPRMAIGMDRRSALRARN
ncbi:MAG: hypothetical protein E6G89_01740 [Alphaproteobacteria bacterium]|nr:MAG: hypothetical protein E6G89_01740 [Alphaproteobacteria bacterium]